jgi:hypothetical protein
MTDRAGWQDAVESELRGLGRELAVPPASDPAATVRRRLAGEAVGRRHTPVPGASVLRRRRLGWRAVVVVVAALLAVLIATPQGRAVITHVFRFAGVELRQGPGPANSPTHAALPGERQTSLEQARHRVSFPILVPAALGRPGEVVVSDRGRVVSLIYRRTPYGLVRIDEFAGHLDQVYFQKFVSLRMMTKVEVNGTKGAWIKGPHELVYVTRDGSPATASARLTTGNTLIWGTSQVALRLEGKLSKAAALAIADSAH